MKTSIIAMVIAAGMAVASCGQKKVEEEVAQPIESVVEEAAAEEVVEEEVLGVPAEGTEAGSEVKAEDAPAN